MQITLTLKVYGGEGISGINADNRPEFQQMLDDCYSSKIDFIITKSISRFSRNVTVTLEAARKLREREIGIYFEKEGLLFCDQGKKALCFSVSVHKPAVGIFLNCFGGRIVIKAVFVIFIVRLFRGFIKFRGFLSMLYSVLVNCRI